jgi:hypothetical protein
MNKTQFLNRFTTNEKLAILQAADMSPEVKLVLFELQNAETIDSNDDNVIAKLQNLETVGLIAQGRAAQILANAPDSYLHNLELVSGTTFICRSNCGKTITFSPFGQGFPSVDESGNPPLNPEQWMGPCDAPD